jgi:hypothetical protein
LIDSFTIANDTDWNAEVIGEEMGATGNLLNKIIRFKHQLPVPFWWETNQRIYVGAIHNLKTNFIWNAPYAEIYPVGTPASPQNMELSKNSIDPLPGARRSPRATGPRTTGPRATGPRAKPRGSKASPRASPRASPKATPNQVQEQLQKQLQSN